MRLFLRLLEEFPNLQSIIDRKVRNMMVSIQDRNKNNLGDIGEFLIVLAFSSYSIDDKQV